MKKSIGGAHRLVLAAALLLAAALPSCALHRHGDEPEGTVATGVPPFYRHSLWEGHEKTNILFPFYRELKTPEREGVLLFPLFWKREFDGGDGQIDMDWTVLPFWTGGTDPEEGDYFLFFPFWGQTRGLLGKDLMRFRFFPLYLDAVQDDYESVHVLWPFVSWGEGPNRSDLRIIPFYAREDHPGVSWSRSVMWPLVTWGQQNLNTKNPTDSVFVFPFYARSKSAIHSSTAVLWPFFTFSDNVEGYTDVSFPWPFFRNMRAPDGRYSWRLWPLMGSMRDEGEEQDFLFWPIFWRTKQILPYGASLTHSVVPFYRNTQYFSNPELENADQGRVLQMWPFFRRIRDTRGAIYFRTFALLPFKGWTDIKANLGWAWTLFEYYEDDTTEKALLLSGLLGYENTPEGDIFRLLWFIEIPK